MSEACTKSACKEFITKFSDQPYRNDERIRFMMEHPVIRKKLDDWLSNPEEPDYLKSHSTSLHSRATGNALFQQKLILESLSHYNEALRHCPFNHPKDMSITLANRSAVLFEMEKYQQALIDIDLALKFGYPEELRHKVLMRKLGILIKIGMYEEGSVLLRKCYELYGETCSVRLSELSDKLNSLVVTDQGQEEGLNFTPNPNYENAASALEIQRSEHCGRRVICNKELRLGDSVFIEDPYASVLLPEYYDYYCYQCHRQLSPYSFFPCPNCTQVKFCSEPCSSRSWLESHQYECLHLKLLSSTGIAHLALRTVLTAGKFLVLRINESDTNTDDDIFKHGQEPYKRVHSLMDHLYDMKAEDAFQYALTASLLTNYLQLKTTFLHLNNEAYIIGGAILRHICQLICNANALSSIECESKRQGSKVAELTQVRVASAIYPCASLMNHACSPNILSVFTNGRSLTVKIAVEVLPAGSELFNCYGPHYRRMNVKDRQEELALQYFFQCGCTFCSREMEDGVLSFADKFSAFKCTCGGPVVPADAGCKSTCSSCGESVDLTQAMSLALKTDELFSVGMEHVNAGRVKEGLVEFLKCYNMRKSILHELHSDLGNFSDCLAKCYFLLGDFPRALKFTKESLAHVRERFGLGSIEWAREFRKYAEVKSSLPMLELDSDFKDLNQASVNILKLYSNT